MFCVFLILLGLVQFVCWVMALTMLFDAEEAYGGKVWSHESRTQKNFIMLCIPFGFLYFMCYWIRMAIVYGINQFKEMV